MPAKAILFSVWVVNRRALHTPYNQHVTRRHYHFRVLTISPTLLLILKDFRAVYPIGVSVYTPLGYTSDTKNGTRNAAGVFIHSHVTRYSKGRHGMRGTRTAGTALHSWTRYLFPPVTAELFPVTARLLYTDHGGLLRDD